MNVPPKSKKGTLLQSQLKFTPITQEEKLENMRRNLKRRRSRSPSPIRFKKGEKSSIQNMIRTQEELQKLKITSKEKYLKGFNKNLNILGVHGIALKKIDSRILTLQFLTSLDLSGNRLTNVDVLRNMNSTIEVVNLSDNFITHLDSRLRFAWAKVINLDLKKNKLRMLPESFAFLSQLVTLDVSHNHLTCLPFHLGRMTGLRNLNISDNDIRFLPYQIKCLKLIRMDISNNSALFKKIGEKNTDHVVDDEEGKVPTLMQLSANVVMKKLPTEYSFPTWPEGLIPYTLMEYLYRLKQCDRCGKLTERYNYTEIVAFSRDFAETVISNYCHVYIRRFLCVEHKETR